ncbi:hypothetical protein ISCGN_002625 [Ixodes scapularis]
MWSRKRELATGPCSDSNEQRFLAYYDYELNLCNSFVGDLRYCLAGDNRFGTREDCIKACVTPGFQKHRCQGHRVGLCEGTTDKVYNFVFNHGCHVYKSVLCLQGNNKFISLGECQKYCCPECKSEFCSARVSEGRCLTSDLRFRFYYDANSSQCVPHRGTCLKGRNRYRTLETCASHFPLKTYAVLVLAVFAILWCQLMGTYPKTLDDFAVPLFSRASRNCSRDYSGLSTRVDIVFVAKWAYRNMKVTRLMTRCLKSILAYSDRSLHFHVLADPQSYMRLRRTLYNVQKEAGKIFQFSLYNITSVQVHQREVIKVMRTLFFTKDVGRYNDDMFFVTEVFHRVFPLQRIIFIDLDLRFEEDIGKLHDFFHCFDAQNLIGIGFDLQPQYRLDFAKYREKHPDSDVGIARPGKQGFNTGVMLMDLDAMRHSKLYNSLLTYKDLKPLCDKYYFKGSLGHQDFFTLVGMEHPELFLVLDCVWNRQLDTGWSHSVKKTVFDEYHKCPGKVRIYHANGGARMPDDRRFASFSGFGRSQNWTVVTGV